MPKAILEFSLPKEEYEFKAATKGLESLALIHEIDEYIRGNIKYNENISKEAKSELQAIRDMIFNSGLGVE